MKAQFCSIRVILLAMVLILAAAFTLPAGRSSSAAEATPAASRKVGVAPVRAAIRSISPAESTLTQAASKA